MATYSKTRRLKKYEAEAKAWATEGEGSPMDLYSPFGPMIGKTHLPAALVQRINEYADGVVMPDAGSEFLLPADFVHAGGEASLVHQTAQSIRRYLAAVENTVPDKVEFEVFWIVSQYGSTPSPVHFHSGDISGVLYLKVPEIDPGEEARTYISGRQAGYINFLSGGKQALSKSIISFKPQVGDFYIFPGWLLHGAEPFRGKGERRSMAFNASLTCADS